jgi:hypothetical protein
MTRNDPPPGYGSNNQQPPYNNYPNQYPPQEQYSQNPHFPVPSYNQSVPYRGNNYGPLPQQSHGASSEYYNSSTNYDRPTPLSQSSYPNQQAPYSHQPPTYGYTSLVTSSTTTGPMPGVIPAGANPNDPERGVMGALAGGAAGAYAGHEMNHGVLGALGGAFAGHKLEDAYKDHDKEKKKKKKEEEEYAPPTGPPPAYTQQPGGYGPQQIHMAGNFSGSSSEIALDRDNDLIARCRAVDGSERMSALSLNKVLRNDNGHFVWVDDGGNFNGSARNVRLVDNGRVIEAELRDHDGGWRFSRVYLDERIGNNDGELVIV